MKSVANRIWVLAVLCLAMGTDGVQAKEKFYCIALGLRAEAEGEHDSGRALEHEPLMNDVLSYTPSSLLLPGQFGIKIFNNLYTQTASFGSSGKKEDDAQRSTYFTGIFNFLYGVGPRMNIGLDLYFKSVLVDEKSTSPLNVFKFSGGSNARTAATSLAPNVKIAPLAMLPALAVQTSVIFPVASDLEGLPQAGSPFLDYDAVQWWTQFFYDLHLAQHFMLYLESSTLLRFFSARTDFLTPAKLMLNYYPSRRWIIYTLSEIGPTWDGASWSSYYSQIGLGGKYQLTPHLELETLVSVFPVGKTNGAGQTYNLGIRIIH